MRTLLCAVAVVVLAACHRPESDALRLGYLPNLTHAQALVGAADGTFQRALGQRKLTLRPFNAGPAAMEALLAGSLDACYVGSGPAITAYVRASGLHIIAGAASGGSVFAVKEARSARDLLGKRVSSPQLGNTQDVALRFWLKGQGLKVVSGSKAPDAVLITPLANPDILGLFRRGELAGAWVPEPWGARLVHEAGGRILVDERTLWPGGRFPTTVLVASDKALRERRGELLALVRAHVALTQRATADKAAFAAQANQAFAALTSHPLPEAVLEDAMSRMELTVNPLEPQLKVAAAHAAALGFIPNADITGLVDDSLLRELGAAAVR